MLAAGVALVLGVSLLLQRTRLGLAIRAVAQDEETARTMGIDVARYKLAMLALGAAFAGLAGALEAHYTFMVAPGTYSFTRVVDMLVYAVVGGTGIFYGPVVGATFLTLLPEVLREVSSRVGLQPGPLRLFVNGLVLLLVILFLPEGISSLPRRVRAWLRSRREAHAA
jgi:branched-chain amino acid transport system permease protein